MGVWNPQSVTLTHEFNLLQRVKKKKERFAKKIFREDPTIADQNGISVEGLSLSSAVVREEGKGGEERVVMSIEGVGVYVFDPRGKRLQTLEGLSDAEWIVPFQNENDVPFSSKMVICQLRECGVYGY